MHSIIDCTAAPTQTQQTLNDIDCFVVPGINTLLLHSDAYNLPNTKRVAKNEWALLTHFNIHV